MEVFPGYRFISNPCNMDVTGYHNLFLFCMLTMIREFELGIPDIISLHSAAEVVPHTGAFFAMACNIVLHYSGRCSGGLSLYPQSNVTFKPYMLGLMVGKLSLALFQEFWCWFAIGINNKRKKYPCHLSIDLFLKSDVAPCTLNQRFNQKWIGLTE